jgi:GGDEF domain-containing protein
VKGKCGEDGWPEVLKAIARALPAAVGDDVMLARVEECGFSVVLPQGGIAAAGPAHTQLRTEVERRVFRMPGHVFSVTVSGAVVPLAAGQLDEVLERARKAYGAESDRGTGRLAFAE